MTSDRMKRTFLKLFRGLADIEDSMQCIHDYMKIIFDKDVEGILEPVGTSPRFRETCVAPVSFEFLSTDPSDKFAVQITINPEAKPLPNFTNFVKASRAIGALNSNGKTIDIFPENILPVYSILLHELGDYGQPKVDDNPLVASICWLATDQSFLAINENDYFRVGLIDITKPLTSKTGDLKAGNAWNLLFHDYEKASRSRKVPVMVRKLAKALSLRDSSMVTASTPLGRKIKGKAKDESESRRKEEIKSTFQEFKAENPEASFEMAFEHIRKVLDGDLSGNELFQIIKSNSQTDLPVYKPSSKKSRRGRKKGQRR